MRNIIVFNGKSSADFGLYVGVNSNENAPTRRTESVVVPGRNGTLTLDGGAYENIDVSYTAFIRADYDAVIPAVRSFYLSNAGYKRLEDSAHPEEYRMAKYKDGLEVAVSQMRQQGYFTLTFDCMPQRFLKIGEIPVYYSESGTIYNLTEFPAKPLIRVYGNGELGVGENTLTITGTTGYTDIDCESMDAYADGENRNSNVSGVFPVLEPGVNGVSLGSGITQVEITPRWWIL